MYILNKMYIILLFYRFKKRDERRSGKRLQSHHQEDQVRCDNVHSWGIVRVELWQPVRRFRAGQLRKSYFYYN